MKIEFYGHKLANLEGGKKYWVTPTDKEHLVGLTLCISANAEGGKNEKNIKYRKGKTFYYKYRLKDHITKKSKTHYENLGSWADISIDEAIKLFKIRKQEIDGLKLGLKTGKDPRNNSLISDLLKEPYFSPNTIETLDLLFMRMYGDYRNNRLKVNDIAIEHIIQINSKLRAEKHPTDIKRDTPARRAKDPRSPAEHAKVKNGYGLAPNTVARQMAALKGFLNTAVDFEYIPRNPMSTASAKNRITTKTSQRRNITTRTNLVDDEDVKFVRYWYQSKANWQRYLNRELPFKEAEEPYLRLIAIIAFETGARINEIRNLTYQQFDFETMVIWRDERFAKDLKSRRDATKHDFIAITSAVKDEVEDYWKAAYCGRKITINKETGHLFWNRQTLSAIGEARKSWKKFLHRAGIEKIGFHGLRRTLGRDLYALSNNILAVSNQLGHSDSKVTEQHYIELKPNVKHDDLNQLSKNRRQAINTKHVAPEGYKIIDMRKTIAERKKRR